MPPETMDHAAKERVRAAILAEKRAGLRATAGESATERGAATLDDEATLRDDDLSHSDEEGEISGLLADSARDQQAALQQIEDLDVSPTTRVGPGAIVGFDGSRYLVGVVSGPVECDGATYEGLSTDAPVYAVLEGLSLGDTFTFRERQHRVDFLA